MCPRTIPELIPPARSELPIPVFEEEPEVNFGGGGAGRRILRLEDFGLLVPPPVVGRGRAVALGLASFPPVVRRGRTAGLGVVPSAPVAGRGRAV